MRIAGYILVCLGFVLHFVWFSVGASERRAIQLGRDVKWLGERETIPRDEVVRRLGETNRMWSRTQSGSIWLALLIVAGAVLLDASAVRRRREKARADAG